MHPVRLLLGGVGLGICSETAGVPFRVRTYTLPKVRTYTLPKTVLKVEVGRGSLNRCFTVAPVCI